MIRISAVLLVAIAIAHIGQASAQECDEPAPGASVTVEYGGGAASTAVTQAVMLAPSVDGVLHAVDVATRRELWAFTAPELAAVSGKTGLITDVRVLRFDANHDGTIDVSNGDKVWAYFGGRRAGQYYYALDITDRFRSPRVLWKLGPDVLAGLGEAWSTPTITRVRITGATQNGEHFVLVIGGGYDDATSQTGHRIFMVDAETGHLLWYAGGPGGEGEPDLVLPELTHAIPARVAVVDYDGDEFADRLYAADLGGRIWRFDIWNGHARSSLVTGGVFADLGATAGANAGSSSPAASASESARRFYNAPDVALIQPRGADPYYNLAIGSGDAHSPGDSSAHDRFYSIRDRNPFTKLAQPAYEEATPILDSDLVDITAGTEDLQVPPNASGWKVDLQPGGGWAGEKVLGEALTLNGVILFTTYQPLAASSTPTCAVGGSNRVYAIRIDTGKAALDLNDDHRVTDADRSMSLSQGGIAGEISVRLAPPQRGGASGGPIESPPEPGGEAGQALAQSTQCAVGEKVLAQCVPMGAVMRTFWQRRSIE